MWPPAVNQVEMHPYFAQEELAAYCEREGILLQAYASLGGQDAPKKHWEALGGRLLEAETVVRAASAAGGDATPAQVLLRWALERGAAVIPKTVSAARLSENAGALDVKLPPETVRELSAMDRGGEGRLCWRADPLRMLDFE